MDGVVSEGWSSAEMGRLPVSQPEFEEVHVLAVDDSLVDRKVIEHLLKVSSCKVTAVDSGTRALQFLGLNGQEKSSVRFDLKVDLIITDYCMPEMTGFELLKKIKGSSTLREIPVVIMSSENVLTRIDRCLEEGAEDFIVKPVKLSDVKRLLNYYMMREIRRAESEEIEEHTNRQVNLDGGEGRGAGFCNKRKQRESYDFSSSTQSILSSTTSSSLSNSPSISPLSSSSPQDSPPSTPTPLDQQIQRVENDLIVNTN